MALSRPERLRRVILLCCHFARNLAYYREGQENARVLPEKTEFWVTVNGNFMDQAVLECCKLLGDKSGQHYWRKVIADPDSFESELFHKVDRAKFDGMLQELRTYRNKIVAHLDAERVMQIPSLQIAYDAVRSYFAHVQAKEAQAGDLAGLPTDLDD